MKRISSLLVTAVLVLAVPGRVSAEMRTVTDMAGRSVSVPTDPQRIVCLGAGTLRLIVYLKATDLVVGVEDVEKLNPGGRPYTLAHPEFARLPRIGPGGRRQ